MGEEDMSYRTVRIPEVLALQIDKISDYFGYRSRAEFVNEAIRRFLELKKAEMKDPPKEEKVVA